MYDHLNGNCISIILSLVSRVFLRDVFLRGMGPPEVHIVCQCAVVVRKHCSSTCTVIDYSDALSFQAVVKSASLILKKVPVMLYALTVLDINYAGIIDISRRNGK